MSDCQDNVLLYNPYTVFESSIFKTDMKIVIIWLYESYYVSSNYILLTMVGSVFMSVKLLYFCIFDYIHRLTTNFDGKPEPKKLSIKLSPSRSGLFTAFSTIRFILIFPPLISEPLNLQ